MMALAEMTIEQAAALLGVQAGLLQPFAVADPFHDGCRSRGFSARRPTTAMDRS
jgi:hypothetical protein